MHRLRAPDWSWYARASRHQAGHAASQMPGDRPRVVIVGPCAAGKSSLAAALQAQGYDVHICAQEHSEVAHLWALSEPDVLVYLSVELGAIRQRRADPSWPDFIYAQQQRRLTHALAHCHVYIDTSSRGQASVLAVALAGLGAMTGHSDDASRAGEH